MPGEAKTRPVWGYFVVAGLLLAVAIVQTLACQGEVSCGSKTMRPGDKCVNYKNGDTSTYEEQERAQEQTPIWFGGAGAVFAFVGAVVGIFRKLPDRQTRQPPDPQAERDAWEIAYTQTKAREIERLLRTTSPEKQEEMRAALEQGFAKEAAKYRKKRGWTGSG